MELSFSLAFVFTSLIVNPTDLVLSTLLQTVFFTWLKSFWGLLEVLAAIPPVTTRLKPVGIRLGVLVWVLVTC